MSLEGLSFTISNEYKAMQDCCRAVDALYDTDAVLFLNKNLKIKKWDEKKDLRITRMRGGCNFLASKNDPRIQFIDANSFESALLIVKNDRLDGFCATRDSIAFNMVESKMKYSDFGDILFLAPMPVYVYVPKVFSEAQSKEITGAIEALKKKQYFSRRHKEYLRSVSKDLLLKK